MQHRVNRLRIQILTAMSDFRSYTRENWKSILVRVLKLDEIPLVLSEFIENALRYIKGENKIENQMKAWDWALILL